MKKHTIHINNLEQLEVYSHEGPFDEGIEALKVEGLELITARDLAEARILGGHNQPVSKSGLWVAEHPVYFPNTDILVVDRAHSQLLKNPVEAANAHFQNEEVYIGQKRADELREQATLDGKFGVLLLSRTAIRKAIPVEAFADDPYAQFLFKDLAGQYGQFLKEAHINEVRVFVVGINYARQQKSPFGHAWWVGDLSGRSNLNGYGNDLHSGLGRVGGVRRVQLPSQGAYR